MSKLLKKYKIVLIVISVIFILYFIPRAYNAYQKNLTYETIRPGIVKSAEVTEEIVYPDCFEVQDGYDPDIAAEVLRYYNMLPENVRVSFENNGWKVICSSTPVEEIYGYDYSIRGCTDEDEMTIYINNKESSEDTIIHEMGHYIEYVCCYPEHTTEFTDIYNEEVNAFLSETSSGPGNTDTVCEYFAEAYYQIVQDPSVKDTIPKTYEYIMNYVDEI